MTHRTILDPSSGRRTTYGELDRETHDAAFRRCVRCGALPPAPELFVCGRCEADPETQRERIIVEEHVGDYMGQRDALVETFGWRGGWWR